MNKKLLAFLLAFLLPIVPALAQYYPPSGGGGGGSGTVTSVATSNGVAGGTITGSGTITLAKIGQNTALGSITSGSTYPVALSATQLTTIPNVATDLLQGMTPALTDAQILVGKTSSAVQAVALSGDLTITNAGVATIGANKITLAKMATQANNTFLGNISGGAAVPTAVSVANVNTTLGTCTAGDGVFDNVSLTSNALVAASIPAYTGFANLTGSSAAPTSGAYGLYGIAVGATAGTLTASSPSVQVLQGGSAQTYTLPLASTCIGKPFLFLSLASYNSYTNITVQGSDVIYTSYGTLTATTQVLRPNQSCLLMASASGIWQMLIAPSLTVGANTGTGGADGGLYYAYGAGTGTALCSNAGTAGQPWISNGTSAPTTTPSPTLTHMISGGTAPTIAVGAGAGSGGSPAATIKAGDGSSTAHDTDFQVTLTTGTTIGTGVIFTVTFGTAYTVAPCVYVTPANAATAALVGGVTQWYPSSTTTTMVLNSGATGLTAAGAVYAFYVHCGQ